MIPGWAFFSSQNRSYLGVFRPNSLVSSVPSLGHLRDIRFLSCRRGELGTSKERSKELAGSKLATKRERFSTCAIGLLLVVLGKPCPCMTPPHVQNVFFFFFLCLRVQVVQPLVAPSGVSLNSASQTQVKLLLSVLHFEIAVIILMSCLSSPWPSRFGFVAVLHVHPLVRRRGPS